MNEFKKFCDSNGLKPSELGSAEQIAFLAAKSAWQCQQAKIDELRDAVRQHVDSIERLKNI